MRSYIKNLLVSPKLSLKACLEKINENGENSLLVIDKKKIDRSII